MNCDEIIKSNDTYDVIIVTEALERIIEMEPDCIQKINDSTHFIITTKQGYRRLV